jgi:SAM-dependent methyltransferase
VGETAVVLLGAVRPAAPGEAQVLALDGGVDRADGDAIASLVDAEFADRALDLVVDDGLGGPHAVRVAFDSLFPRLRPGGQYRIEGWDAQERLLSALARTLRDPDAPGHEEAAAAVAEGLRRGETAAPPSESMLRLAVELVVAQAAGGGAVASVVVRDGELTVERGGTPIEPGSFQLVDEIADRRAVLADRPGAATSPASPGGPSAPTSLVAVGSAVAAPAPPVDVPPSYEGRCRVCGESATFVRGPGWPREDYPCPHCQSTLRYQGQGEAILALFPHLRAGSLAELATRSAFRRLRIYEPGTMGPLRRFLAPLPGYEQSSFTPGAKLGEVVDGYRNESLEALTYADGSFDLVLTSDVFEHVRHPDRGWREVFRVLRPGGAHVFSIPVWWPVPPETVPRVDVSGPDDVHLLEPDHHFGHLVYNNFGLDVLDDMRAAGFEATMLRFDVDHPVASRLCTFVARRPSSRWRRGATRPLSSATPPA